MSTTENAIKEISEKTMKAILASQKEESYEEETTSEDKSADSAKIELPEIANDTFAPLLDPIFFDEKTVDALIATPEFVTGMTSALELAGFYTTLVNFGMDTSLIAELVIAKTLGTTQIELTNKALKSSEKIAVERTTQILNHSPL